VLRCPCTTVSNIFFRDKQADLNFIKAAREAAAMINLAPLQRELNKLLARVAQPRTTPGNAEP